MPGVQAMANKLKIDLSATKAVAVSSPESVAKNIGEAA
jgi:hypothetical protein